LNSTILIANNKNFKIAIIGAGTAGLATALLLSKHNHQIDLYEEVENPEPVGAGLLLQPQGMYVLNKLGLMNNAIKQGAKVEALIGKNHRSKVVMDFQYADLHKDLFGVGIHRGQLFESLYNKLKQSKVNLLLGNKVLEIVQKVESAKVLTESSKIDYDLVVIANGTWSDLSKTLNIKKSFKPYPWGALWKIFDDEKNQFESILDQKYIKSHTMLGILPTGRNPNSNKPCVSFFYSLKKDQYQNWQNQDINQWKQHVLEIWPELESKINTINTHNDLTFATYADHVMKQWHDGRIVVIGDAAHAMSPQLGQGANMALTDAYQLSEVLAQSETIPTALMNYSDCRRKHLQYYQWASRFLTPLFQSNSWFGATFRDWSFPPMKYIPIAKKHALLTLFGVKPSMFGSKPNTNLEQIAESIKVALINANN
jgi:2-polyprenyl-6-methoxyphenol hydroxylase-like FAD-dependent oxidoreductase